MLRVSAALLVLSISLSFSASANAQPLSARLRVDRHSEHGCSQSHASTHETIDLSLSVDGAGAAELIVERVAQRSFGPSFGRYQEGDRDFSYTTERETHRLTGRARRSAGVLRIELDRSEHASLTHTGFGEMALPPAQRSAASVVVECREASHEVWPAPAAAQPGSFAADTERARSHAGVTCTLSGLPSTLATLGAEPLPFVRGASVVLHVNEGWGQPARLLRLRR